MNYSEIKDLVYSYLSYRNMTRNEATDMLICEILDEIASYNSFKCIFAEYDSALPFLDKDPYSDFLCGAKGYYLLMCTLGGEIDRKIQRLAVTDAGYMVIFDACANAYLEYKAEEYKKSIYDNLSYTFCPGYQGSNVSDIQYIYNELKGGKIGIELTSSYMMLPMKSMAGIIAKDISPIKRCGKCSRLDSCAYRKAGKLCFKTD